MSELTFFGEFVAKNWIVVVRSRETSHSTGRILFSGVALIALMIMQFISSEHRGNALRDLLDYWPYLALIGLALWGYLRQRVCFGKRRIARGWLMPRGVFLGCRSWAYSEIGRVESYMGYWNCTLTFYPEKTSDAVLTVSVSKKSEALRSIVALLSQGMSRDQLCPGFDELLSTQK